MEVPSGCFWAPQAMDSQSRDKSGRLPLSWAAEKGHGVVVEVFLGAAATDINSRDAQGRTPLLLAAIKDRLIQ